MKDEIQNIKNTRPIHTNFGDVNLEHLKIINFRHKTFNKKIFFWNNEKLVPSQLS